MHLVALSEFHNVMMQGGRSWTDVEEFYRHTYQVNT